ncbi:MAG TPA: DNA gyrase inhibitor YacG [Thermohalobaculum sp.]|nr:DNA gyrase inhibitor YacG [Thermohalobaculum sp.]
MARDTASGERRRAPGCPICGRPQAAASRPFCSRRCADLDLGRWLIGVYAVPAEEDMPDGEAEID